MQNPLHVIDIVVEGKADGGFLNDKPEIPDKGIVTLFVHRLCHSSPHMRVRRLRVPFLLNCHKPWRRVLQAKDRAAIAKSAALVYVVDTESTDGTVLNRLRKSHQTPPKSKHDTFRAAIGFSHPCIEAWLLADALAICRGACVSSMPVTPGDPESLPGAPKNAPGKFYKRHLADLAKQDTDDLSAKTKWRIVNEIDDLQVVRTKCPSFDHFATEVGTHLAPLFPPPVVEADADETEHSSEESYPSHDQE